jgi:hypothetical protein
MSARRSDGVTDAVAGQRDRGPRRRRVDDPQIRLRQLRATISCGELHSTSSPRRR